MDLAHIIQSDNTWQIAGTLDYNPVIKHFYLYVSPFDAIVTMSRGIDNNFLPFQLAKDNKKFQISKVAKDARFSG